MHPHIRMLRLPYARERLPILSSTYAVVTAVNVMIIAFKAWRHRPSNLSFVQLLRSVGFMMDHLFNLIMKQPAACNVDDLLTDAEEYCMALSTDNSSTS